MPPTAYAKYSDYWLAAYSSVRPTPANYSAWQYSDAHYFSSLGMSTDASRVMTNKHPLSYWLGSTIARKRVNTYINGGFKRQLTYKCEWYGKQLVLVDRWYPSSQLCSNCGYRFKGTKDLNVREWVCPQCGKHHSRDVNAAINILNYATVGTTDNA